MQFLQQWLNWQQTGIGNREMSMRFMTSLRFVDAVAREKSIRKAAEKLAITSTALNRRILQIEEEIGQPLFERLPSGVRLNTAGELFVQHIRTQQADLARVQSQIADLSGIRRGHVRVAGGAETLRYFLPDLVARYRAEHNAVTFDITRQHGNEAETALGALEIDLALIFEPIRSRDFQTMVTAHQQIHCCMAPDHPLARFDTLRLHHCIDVPAILPTTQSGIRQLLNVGLMRRNVRFSTVIETDSQEFIQNYPADEQIISFQIPIGMPAGMADGKAVNGMVARPLDMRDVPQGTLHIGQLNGRVLPVAAAKFLDSIIAALGASYPQGLSQ
jgi:DNA-binding transcriptional LysR family regulator